MGTTDTRVDAYIAKSADLAKPILTHIRAVVPDYFIAALRKDKKALAAFEKVPPSHKREYVEWVTEAKGEDTRNRRLAQAVQWIAEGKQRNWKYM